MMKREREGRKLTSYGGKKCWKASEEGNGLQGGEHSTPAGL